MYDKVVVTVVAGVVLAAILGAWKAWREWVKETREARELAKRVAAEVQRQTAEATDRRINALYNCNLALAHDRIYAECMQHIAQGYMTTASLDNMGFLMRGYEGVGGDSTAHILWEKVKGLPIDDSKEPNVIRGSFDQETKERNLKWKNQQSV